LPVLVVVTQFIQQRMTAPQRVAGQQMDQQQQMMNQFGPPPPPPRLTSQQRLQQSVAAYGPLAVQLVSSVAKIF